MCAFDVSEKETNSSSRGTRSGEFLQKDRLLINTIVMFILLIIFFLLSVFSGIINFLIDPVIRNLRMKINCGRYSFIISK